MSMAGIEKAVVSGVFSLDGQDFDVENNVWLVGNDDEVLVVRGDYKDSKGRVNAVYRKRWCIYVDKVAETKQNGASVKIPLDPSNVVLTKLKLTPDRQALLERKAAGRGDKGKGKYTEADVKDK